MTWCSIKQEAIARIGGVYVAWTALNRLLAHSIRHLNCQSATMASHEELVAEIPKLEKMSNAARLKLAKKRRQRQLKKYQELVRTQRTTSGLSSQSVRVKRSPPKISFVESFLLQEAVVRNDLGEG